MWVPARVYREENIEYGEDVGDRKVQIPKGEVSSGTNPRSSTFSVVR